MVPPEPYGSIKVGNADYGREGETLEELRARLTKATEEDLAHWQELYKKAREQGGRT